MNAAELGNPELIKQKLMKLQDPAYRRAAAMRAAQNGPPPPALLAGPENAQAMAAQMQAEQGMPQQAPPPGPASPMAPVVSARPQITPDAALQNYIAASGGV